MGGRRIATAPVVPRRRLRIVPGSQGAAAGQQQLEQQSVAAQRRRRGRVGRLREQRLDQQRQPSIHGGGVGRRGGVVVDDGDAQVGLGRVHIICRNGGLFFRLDSAVSRRRFRHRRCVAHPPAGHQ